MNRIPLTFGLFILLLSAVSNVTSRSYFIIVFYNEANEAIFSEPIASRKIALVQRQAAQYILARQSEKAYYYYTLGPFDFEEKAIEAQLEKRDLFRDNGFRVETLLNLMSAQSTTDFLQPTPLDFGRLSSTQAVQPTNKWVHGYIKAAHHRLYLRVYSETADSKRGELLYEGRMEKGALIKIQSEYGRIVYNYKENERDLWGGAIYINCKGSINEATSIP